MYDIISLTNSTHLTADTFFLNLLDTEEKCENHETVCQAFIDFKKAYVSIKKEVLYNILIESGGTMKLVRLIKMCLIETNSKVHIGKYFLMHFLLKIV
jgi:hypothetical protein